MKKTKTKSKASPKGSSTLITFLLDRSGSMPQCRDETIQGFNTYLDTMMAETKGQNVGFSLVQFDSVAIEPLHTHKPLAQVAKLSKDTYLPRSMTPLYDAIGQTVKAIDPKAADKILFVTLTDGLENASREYDVGMIRALILDKEREGWTFAHIGVGPQGWSAVQTYSSGTQSSSNVLKSSHQETRAAYRSFAKAGGQYVNSGAGGCSVQNFFVPSDAPDKPKATKPKK